MAAVVTGSGSDAADFYVRDHGGGIRQDAVVRKQGEEGSHRPVAGADQPAVGACRRAIVALRGARLLVFRVRSGAVVFGGGGLPCVLAAGAAMHGARASVGTTHGALGGRRCPVATHLRRPMCGAAVARNERRHPRDLEHEPGHGNDAPVPSKSCHPWFQFIGMTIVAAGPSPAPSLPAVGQASARIGPSRKSGHRAARAIPSRYHRTK